MRRRSVWGMVLAASLGALPAPASAGVADVSDSLDAVQAMAVLRFRENSPERGLLNKTMGLCGPLLFLALVAGLTFELTMGEEARYGVVLRRFAIALVLMLFYHAVFGTMLNMLDGLATRLAPPAGALTAYLKTAEKMRLAERLKQLSTLPPEGNGASAEDGVLGKVASAWDSAKTAVSRAGDAMGERLYDTLIYFSILVCEAILFVILLSGKMLTAMFYILGPIAIPLGVPRASGVSARWFKELLTYSSWAVFIAMFLTLLVGIGAGGIGGGSVLGALVSAGVMAFAAIRTPAMAEQLIGGSIGNIAHGAADLVQQKAHGPAERAAEAARSGVGRIGDAAKRALQGGATPKGSSPSGGGSVPSTPP